MAALRLLFMHPVCIFLWQNIIGLNSPRFREQTYVQVLDVNQVPPGPGWPSASGTFPFTAIPRNTIFHTSSQVLVSSISALLSTNLLRRPTHMLVCLSVYLWLISKHILSYFFLQAGFDKVHQASVTVYNYKATIRPSVPVVRNFPPLPFSNMSTRAIYQGPRRKLVLAFDVGTTYSGISYRYDYLQNFVWSYLNR